MCHDFVMGMRRFHYKRAVGIVMRLCFYKQEIPGYVNVVTLTTDGSGPAFMVIWIFRAHTVAAL
jgi:hypothetical protein